MQKNRPILRKIEDRLKEKRPLIQVLVGPRQVGKTTLIHAALKNRGIFHTADSPTPIDGAIIKTWWAEALKQKQNILAIDEVQKIVGWAEVVKYLWDEDNRNGRNLKVLLSGSAALLLEKGLKESLSGRFELIRCPHWSFSEAKTIMDLDLSTFIEFGCYPGSCQFLSDIERWGEFIRDAIVEPAIGRDILQLQPVENPSLLRQVFGAAISRPAQIISLNKMQGMLHDKGALATVQHYLEILSQGFLISLIQKYSEQPIRLKQSPNKIVVNDNALIRAFMKPIKSSVKGELLGRFFENAIGSALLKKGWELYYWTDRNKEVDFVGLGPNGEKWAIEVKTTKTKESELRGLFGFCSRYPEFEPILVSLADSPIETVRSIAPADLL